MFSFNDYEDMLYVRPRKTPKKRKKFVKPEKKYNLILAQKDSEKYYIGDICIGTTNNVLSDTYKKCTAKFQSTNDDSDDSLHFQFDNETILVKVAMDTNFLKGLFDSKVITFKFLIAEEKFFICLHFKSLPIVNTTKTVKVLKPVFNLIFDVASDMEEKENKKRLSGPEDILLLYNSLEDKHKISANCDKNVQHVFLKPQLHPYQVSAVKWMLTREDTQFCEANVLNPLYQRINLPSGMTIYFDKYSGIVETKEPLIKASRTGGILADEMGLGKTVEVLACILNNPMNKDNFETADPIIELPSRKRKLAPTFNLSSYVDSSKKLKVPANKSTRAMLTNWYEETLAPTKRKKKERQVACLCGNTDNINVVECVDCHKLQHSYCTDFDESYGNFVCCICWNKNPVEPCKGTLIVCPGSLKNQWVEEISKHMKGNLNVLVYKGFTHAPIYPTKLLKYDIVITTYTVLQNELRLTEVQEERNLRNPRKYCQAGCPIVNMKWWRLCFDEAQVIENRTMVAEMAQRIAAVHRWAITGTPISKNMSDIFVLVNFLQIEPYSEEFCWEQLLHKPYLKGDLQPMFDFLSKIMWRTSKEIALKQITIPEQKVQDYWIEFTPVERYFYEREHDVRYSDFMRKLKSFDPDMPLRALDKREFKEIWSPFLALRQACVHHNAVKGKYLTTRKPVCSMDHLLEALINKNVSENEEHLRVLISTLNGLAGLQLLLQNPKEAVEEYKKALQHVHKYTELKDPVYLSVDMLQTIHILHNLAEILTGFTDLGSQKEVEDYRNQCKELENKYIDKHNKMMYKVHSEVISLGQSIIEKENKFVVPKHGWYGAAMEFIVSNNTWNEYCNKLTTVFENAAINNVDKFLSRSNEVLYYITRWNDTIQDLRADILEDFNSLYQFDNDILVIPEHITMAAMNCHLRKDTRKKESSKKKCALCAIKEKLKLYQSKLFSLAKDEADNFINTGLLKSSREEHVLRIIYQMIKTKSTTENLAEDGKNHLDLIENIISEYKGLSKFYVHVDLNISSNDEINMCKMRFSLKDTTNAEASKSNRKVQIILKQLESDITTKNVHEIAPNELEYQKSYLRSQELNEMENLERNLGTYGYLNTLKNQQFKGQKPDPCPVCRSVLERHWNILKCGHCYCLDCMQVLIGQAKDKYVICSICRLKQHTLDISYVDTESKNMKVSSRQVRGNVSTKMGAVVELIMQLYEDDNNVKILIFSTWITILNLLQDVLTVNKISSQLIKFPKMEKQLLNFKDKSKGVTTLLMPITLGGKGLNLIEATHVIFLEPLLDVGEELQAVGRVHRIGQTRKTTVHKFLIKDTVEEKIHNAVASDARNWNQNTITPRQIMGLFNKAE